MITEIIDLFCFIGRVFYVLGNLLQVVEFLFRVGQFFSWCARKISALFRPEQVAGNRGRSIFV